MSFRYFFEPCSSYQNFFELVTKEQASVFHLSDAIKTVLSHSKKSTMFLGVDEVLQLGGNATFLLNPLGILSENFLPLCQNSPHPQQSLFVVSTNLNETFLRTLSRLKHTITTEPLPVMETLDQAKQALKNLSTPELETKIKDIIQSREFKLAIIQCGGFPRAVEETVIYLQEQHFNSAITFNQISAHLIDVLWFSAQDVFKEASFEYIVPVIKAESIMPDTEIFLGKQFSDLVAAGIWSFDKETRIPQMPLIRIYAWAQQFEKKASEIKNCCTIVSEFPTKSYNIFRLKRLRKIPIAELAGCYLWEMLNPAVWWESGRGLESFSIYYELLILLLNEERQYASHISHYFPHTIGSADFYVLIPQRLKLAIIKNQQCHSFCKANKWKIPHNTMFWFADNNPGFAFFKLF